MRGNYISPCDMRPERRSLSQIPRLRRLVDLRDVSGGRHLSLCANGIRREARWPRCVAHMRTLYKHRDGFYTARVRRGSAAVFMVVPAEAEGVKGRAAYPGTKLVRLDLDAHATFHALTKRNPSLPNPNCCCSSKRQAMCAGVVL